nr:MAG TPA: hypothetical protein [Caudoviricetes sp.]
MKAGFLSPVQKPVAILPPLEKKKGLRFHVTPLFYLVELAGVEPASEISTSSVLHA